MSVEFTYLPQARISRCYLRDMITIPDFYFLSVVGGGEFFIRGWGGGGGVKLSFLNDMMVF